MAGVTSPFSTTNLHSAAPVGYTLEATRKRQVYDLIDLMSPMEVPFLKLVGIDGDAGTNPRHEWLEDTLLAETGTLNGTITSGVTSLAVASGTGHNFQPYMVINIDSEYMFVSNVSSDTLTVVRGIASTSAASHNDTATIYIVGLATQENTDSPYSSTTDPDTRYNYFQAFDTSYKISDIGKNTDVYGAPEGDDARELDKKFKEIVIKLERTAIYGKRADRTATTPRLMGGLTFFVDTSGTFGNYQASLSGAQLTEKDINDMLQDRYQTVGYDNMGKTLLVGSWNKRRISDMYAPYARQERSSRTGGVVVDTIDTEWGPIDVLLSLRCPADKVYLLNTDFISVHPYSNLAFFDQELAKSGAYTVRQIYGVYSMRVRNARAMGVIHTTATS